MLSFIFSIINLFRILTILLVCAVSHPFIGDKSIYIFLRFCGPTFIKLGQLLSSRPDLVGYSLASRLSVFQDKLPAFSYASAKRRIENQSGKKMSELFSEFSKTPVASASIAQVHKAKLIDGRVVAVKILRPRVTRLVLRDITTLKLITFLAGIFSAYSKEKLGNIVKLLESSAAKELDLSLEAAAASELRDKLENVKGFYIPKIYWELVFNKVLVMEWIDGIPFSNKDAINNSNFDKVEIARNLVISYFNQVYVHGFFHADMHPGNLFLMKNGDIGVVDFGIIGVIDKKTRIAVAEILMGFLQRDYRKVAEIHLRAGLVPQDTDINEFTLTCRIIGESVVDLSVKQISLASLMGKLLKMARKYNMNTRPELLLLQKTMMLVEGVGVAIDENLNMWELSSPWMKEWAVKNIGFDAKIRDNMLELVDFLKKLPDLLEKNFIK